MAALLACEQLSMRFGGLIALDRLTCAVRQNEVLGLIGPNGSGKTTFFNLLTGIYRPSAGVVQFDGRNITALTPQAIYRAGIARTFQRSRLCLPLSMFDNMMIGGHKRLNHALTFNLFRRNALARQVAQKFDEARALLKSFHAPLAERMNEPLAGLNMIDRRRVEVCRALMSEPKLLLLDEPSAGMTHDETHALMDDILQARERLAGLAIVIIEHEMNVIERVTERCIVLNFGQKICEGSYREVAANRDVQEAYLGVGV